MTRYRFELADPSDDASLRALSAATPMPGAITLAFEREPDYFRGNRVFGVRNQTIVCRDTSRGTVVGIATRSVKRMYLRDRLTTIGYLSGLRFASHVRGIGLLARGFRFLKELHEQDPDRPTFYLTTIASDNQIAKRALTRSRAGLPTYHPIGILNTFVIPKRRPQQARILDREFARSGVTAESLADQDAHDSWMEWINRPRRGEQIRPAYEDADFDSPSGRFVDLLRDDIVILKRHGVIVATGAAWDQSSYKQTVIRGYGRSLRLARRIVNAWSRRFGGMRLPAVGEALSAAPACCLAVRDHDPKLMRLLLTQLLWRCRCENLLIGCCANDPMIEVCSEISPLRYRTDLYAVNWDRDADALADLRGAPFSLELGCL